jgi:hypothetical protein
MNQLPKYIALLLLIAVAPGLFAQTISARLDLGKRDPKPDFYEFSPVDGGLVTLGPTSTISTRFLGITKYNSNLEKEWSKKVLEQNGRKNIDFVAVIGTNILVFVSEFFPAEGVIKTYYYGYDLEGNQQADEELLSVYPNQKEQKVELQYELSRNKRKLLCYKNLENKRESEEILFYLFDDEGNLAQNGEINLKYPDNHFNVRRVRVSNQGNIYLLGRFFRTVIAKDSDDFKYLIYRYDTERQQGEEIQIELGDRYISDLAFSLQNESIYVAGFYSNRGTDRIAGTVLQQIDPGGNIVLNTSEAFDEGFLSNYLSNNQINRGSELRNFYLKDIILRSDGGVLMMAEKFYITHQSYRDFYGYWVDREIYHYEDVILTSVSASGQIEWHAIVDKNQVAESPATLSYFHAISGIGVYIFYEYKPRGNEANVYYNQVGMQGGVSERYPLLKNYHFTNEFYPRFCEQVSNNEAILVYFQNRGGMLSVVKLNFES